MPPLARCGALTLLGWIACNDPDHGEATRSLRPSQPLISTQIAEGNWDTFSADVALTITGTDPIASASPRARRISFHSERTLGADSTWVSSVTFVEAPTMTRASSSQIRSIVFNEGTGIARGYNADGREVSKRARDSLLQAISLKASLPADTASAQRRLRSSKFSRGWSENIVLGPDARQRRLASLTRAFGNPIGQRGTRDVYHMARGGAMIEVTVEPSTGLIVNQTVERPQVQMANATYLYSEFSPGVFVRTGSHLEVVPSDRRRQTVVVDETLSNVRFERRGGVR